MGYRIFKNNRGFTLAEVLIVVAILSVISAIAIPMLLREFEYARENKDISNIASAEGQAAGLLMRERTGTFYYDQEAGTLVSSKDGIAAYGSGTSANGGCDDYTVTAGNVRSVCYESTTEARGKILKVTVATDESGEDTVTIEWVEP